ncbi:hypothetical protein [Tropicibacter naphthalenivorans]|uniref:Uncharacterized protein n=1 Tax=Tropicibacter naphthalenivorans TaxID=441103 RepID=A0A0P1G9K1_9RHOB|nr:hypothetical protein [Tropicibacter naphthalenivorans]CUH78127.1 hypothetical protein TRN7648_01808 [Tropicibacter naphthalenivorans]SMC93455.1 hypothetical protein SAMN04488093_10733 [Tropicibacter naphthalenivorans]
MKDGLPPLAPLRAPSEVMRLRRMGAMFPTRLSFLRVLTRGLGAQGARLIRPLWQIDEQGHGHAVYTIALGGRDYSLVAVSSDLPAEMRSDRVIATAWDTAYVLYDGRPDAPEIARIVAQAPLQEAGRFTPSDLVLSRANKSVRLFTHVVERLRAGAQPDADFINDVGYLMRTTAVYGNGKFGIADRALIADRPGLSGPFAAEMLTVWMIRNFTHDLAEHLGGAQLDPDLKRQLGIGNSTGLGMAPFLVSHPVLLHRWMAARETALARVCALGAPTKTEELQSLGQRAADHLGKWRVPDSVHQARIDRLRAEWPRVQASMHLSPAEILRTATALSLDTQELTVALLLEPFGALIDDLADEMSDCAAPQPVPFATQEALRTAIEAHFGWALAGDYAAPDACARFWYVSADKDEPRLGDRHRDPGAHLESPLDVARRVQALHRDLGRGDLRAFRMAHPMHELAIARVACSAAHPYAEIRDNLIAADCLPIDMLRCKLSFFGATKFDPKSNLWTRVTLAQGAPLPQDLGTTLADDWWLA